MGDRRSHPPVLLGELCRARRAGLRNIFVCYVHLRTNSSWDIFSSLQPREGEKRSFLFNPDVLDQDDVNVPIPLICEAVPPTGIYSLELHRLSSADLDFSWLVNAVYLLGSRNREHFKTNDMTVQFSSLSHEIFAMGMAAIQHVCARKAASFQTLQILERGVGELYAQYFYVTLRSEEQRIIEALKSNGGLPGSVVVEPFNEAFGVVQ